VKVEDEEKLKEIEKRLKKVNYLYKNRKKMRLYNKWNKKELQLNNKRTWLLMKKKNFCNIFKKRKNKK
jgi:hypothetical protein